MSLLFSSKDYQEECYDEIYNSSLLESEKKNAENILKNNIKQSVGTNNDAFDVSIILEKNSDEFYISAVEVKIFASGVTIDPHLVEKYINDELGCRCEIIYDF